MCHARARIRSGSSSRTTSERNRLTVFFRLFLAIPHLIWFVLWSIAVVLVAILNWFATLDRRAAAATGSTASCARTSATRAPQRVPLRSWATPIRASSARRASTRSTSQLPGPVPQSRWKTLIRLFLAIPALASRPRSAAAASFALGRAAARQLRRAAAAARSPSPCAVLGWFAALARGRMPKGLRDAGAYAIGYSAQVLAYLLSSPIATRTPTRRRCSPGSDRPPRHPVHLVGDPTTSAARGSRSSSGSCSRSRTSIWLVLWGIAALLAAIVHWFATLFRGTAGRRRCTASSRATSATGSTSTRTSSRREPVPGLHRRGGSYPLDLELPAPRAAEPLEHRLPDLARHAGVRRRPPRSAGRSPSPRSYLVRRARHRLGALGAAQPSPTRSATTRRRARTCCSSPTRIRTRARSRAQPEPQHEQLSLDAFAA